MSDAWWGQLIAPGCCRGTFLFVIIALFLAGNAGAGPVTAVRQGQALSTGVITAVQQDGKALFNLPLNLAPNVSGEVVRSVTISEEDKDILTGYAVLPFEVEPDGSTKIDIDLNFFGLPGEVRFAVTVRTSSNSTYKIEPTFGVIGISLFEDRRDSQGKLRMFTGPDAEVLNIPPNGEVFEVSGRAFAGTSGIPRASIWFDSAIGDIPWDDNECDSLVDLSTEKASTCSISFKSPETEVFQIRSKKETANSADQPETFDIVWFGVASAIRGAGLDPENKLNDPRVSVRVREAEVDAANKSLIRASIWCTLAAISLLFASALCCVYACSKSKVESDSVLSHSTRSHGEMFKPEGGGVNPNASISNSLDGNDSGQWENVKEADEKAVSSLLDGQPMAKYAFREGAGDSLDQQHESIASPNVASPDHYVPPVTLKSATTDSTTDPYTSKATLDDYNVGFANSTARVDTSPRRGVLETQPGTIPVLSARKSMPPDRRTMTLFESPDPNRSKRNGRPPENLRVHRGRVGGYPLNGRSSELSQARTLQSNSASSNSASPLTESTWSSAEFTNGGATTATSSISYGASSAREPSRENDNDGYATHDLRIDSTTYGSPPSAQSGPVRAQDRRQTDTLWSERSSASDGESSSSADSDGRDNIFYQVPDDDSSREALQVVNRNAFPNADTRERTNSERRYNVGRYSDAVDPRRSSPVSSGFAQEGIAPTLAPNWTERWSRAVVDKFKVRRQARGEGRRERISPTPRDSQESPGYGSHFVVAAPQPSLPMSAILQDFPWGTHRTSDSERPAFQGYRR